jgi:hypothetical protein
MKSSKSKSQGYFLVAVGFVVIVLVTLVLFRESNKWPVVSRGTVSVETTFTTLETEFLPVFSKHDSTLLASTSAWGLPGQIAVGSRRTGEILIFPDSEVGWGGDRKQLTLDEIWQPHVDALLGTFMLDIASFRGDFFVSSVGIEHVVENGGPCAFIGVDRLTQSSMVVPSISRVWVTPFCVPISDLENPGWHDIHGRLVVEDQLIFLSTGAFLNETYEGTFPNRGLRNLPDSRESADSKFEFFGRLISIDRGTGGFSTLAKGLRGPSGLAADGNGEYFLIADHGPRGGDELNIVSRSDGSSGVEDVPNFGWPMVSLGASYSVPTGDYSELIDTAFDEHEGFNAPIFSWVPSIAPSQVMQIPTNGSSVLGRNFKEGDWILTSLKAESIFHLRLAESGSRALYSEQIEIGSRIRSISMFADGLLLSTDDGQIVKLRQSGNPLNSEGAFPPVSTESPIYDSDLVKFLRSAANTFLDWISLRG